MICPQCQEVLKDSARFCSNCGLSFASLNTPTERAGAYDRVETLPLPDPLIGRVLDEKYELIARIGEGGMGTVYRARRVHIGDEVAVKVLLQKYVADRSAVERFRREARAAAMLRHPNVVAIIDYGEARGEDAPGYIVMELVEGASLRVVLEREGKLDPGRAVALMRDICAGVGSAHRRHIWHRDLKPDNIIVLAPDEDRERETVKVVDFGIAKLRDMAGGPTLTQAGVVMGTPYYMSPEQCRGESLDARSDVYSLGAMLYEMLTGAPPFTAQTLTGVVTKHLTEVPRPLPKDLGVPSAVEAAMGRALAKDPEARQQDATQLARELQEAVKQPAATIPTPTVEADAVHPPPPTRPSPQAGISTLKGQTPPYAQVKTSPDRGSSTDPDLLSRQRRGIKLWLGLGAAAVVVTGLVITASLGLWSGINKPVIKEPEQTSQVTTPAPAPSPAESRGATVPLGALLGVLTTQHELYEVALSPDGQMVASTGNENRVRLWRVSDRSPIRELTGSAQSGRCVAVSPDGQMVASGNDDGAIRLWRVSDGSLLNTLPGHTKFVFIVGFSPDGQTLVSAGGDKAIRLWRVSDGRALGTVTVTLPGELIITISPDQRVVALYGSDKGVKLWSVNNNNLLRVLEGHRYEVTSGAFSSDGRVLALGSKDGKVRLWNVNDGSLLRALEGAKGEVGSVAFSPDGQMVAGGWSDGTIKLWRVSDGSLLSTLEGHKKAVVSLSFSADGRVLASASDDKTIRLWQIKEK